MPGLCHAGWLTANGASVHRIAMFSNLLFAIIASSSHSFLFPFLHLPFPSSHSPPSPLPHFDPFRGDDDRIHELLCALSAAATILWFNIWLNISLISSSSIKSFSWPNERMRLRHLTLRKLTIPRIFTCSCPADVQLAQSECPSRRNQINF